MKEVIAKITPAAEERKLFDSAVKSFLKQLNPKLKKISAHAVLGGSGAKDTWLAGSREVDVFVLFNYTKYASRTSELSDVLHPILKKTFAGKKIIRLHGSRDYFQIVHQGFTVEIIPILKISKAEQAENITDISPLHAVWVNKKAKVLKAEIRLAKQFLRANKLYGAESYINGFSGYVIEILITYYGSFAKFIQAVRKWKEKEIIDVENHYPKKDALFHLNKSKTISPLIVIDPVDKNRNAAAALSAEKLLVFKKAIKEYLQKPSLKFFEKKENDIAELKQEVIKHKKHLIFITVTPLSGKEDVVGVKIVKAFEFLQKKIQPFEVVKSDWEWSSPKEAIFYFVVNKNQLTEFETRTGPPLKLKENVADFKKKYKTTFTENGRIMAEAKTKYTRLEDRVENMIKENYVREQIKKINKIIII